MKSFWRLTSHLLIVLLLTGCAKPSMTPDASDQNNSGHLVISEVLAGVTGNNNYDYIEIYNPTMQITDLQGYSLWYQLSAAEPDVLIFSWENSAFVPPHGHYLLVRENQDVGVEADAGFNYSLVPQRGSLALLKRGTGVIDQVSWGETDSPYHEDIKAAGMQNGIALERMPGGDAGNGVDQDNNSLDFILNDSPQPQNSASVAVPVVETGLTILVEAPLETPPGSTLEYRGTVTNQTTGKMEQAKVYFPVPEGLEYKDSSVPFDKKEDYLVLTLGDISPNTEKTFSVYFVTPWKYTVINVQGIHATAGGVEAPAFSQALRTTLTGGSVPIGIARTLLGSEGVTVEGIATMYTGGLYAGSSGVKFYVEDETGGIQVYVPGGSGSVEIPLGAYVRVKGIPQPYRGAIELVPSPSDITILKQPENSNPKESMVIEINEILSEEENFAGELVTLAGEVSRVEEFSYSYEIDLLQADAVVGVYVDKLTLVNVEAIEVGQYYQITGIAEMLDDEIQIYPRVQDDLVEIQPPAVTMDAVLPVNYSAGEQLTLGITITNYLPEPVHDLQLVLEGPVGFTPEAISEGGKLEQGKVTWQLAELSGEGSQVKFEITGQPSTGEQFIELENYALTYAEIEDPLIGETRYSFLGATVPVWAIQGSAFRSPYVLQNISTTGVVTGVFPELEGYWIQGEMDNEDATSQGLFIHDPDLSFDVNRGDSVEVAGTVHESHGETQLFLESLRVLGRENGLPPVITLDPPVDEIASEQYYEQLEGMLVQVKGSALAVSATNKYGETALILPRYDIDHLMQGSENGMAIRVDDGSFVTHTDQTTMSYAATSGDMLTGLSGPLAYNYGYYKIEPLNLPQVIAQDRLLPSLPETTTGQIRIMTWNVENLFDFLLPHPTDPALPSVSEYKANIEKIANTIVLADLPVVIGFQEVEHIGILEDLAESPQLSASGYQAVLLEGTDSRGIDVGYLVRGDAAILEVQQYAAPNELTSRPPLMLKVEIKTGSGSQVLYLLNNHFLSMSGGEKATEPRRVAQAAWNVQIIEQILTQDPNAQIILMGDLNSYLNSPPIDTLRDSGLVHVFDTLPPEARYTYIYQGVAQVLDHILINGLLESKLYRVDILHTNSDFPLQPSGDTSVLHKSDHDPVVITLDF